ncbi:MAG: hypothetical protein A2Y17_03230 [Clostridiales bacterium GWF2_38_85]|nr:MAG: hypothetical protein A2Y17_03230 [Clostridiales bacterium GWF2_38_85]HBL85220.1 hypothetical protein [Clostridiales bacterium]
MQLYIIRHGDPDYANDTLTEYGWEQARELAKRMAAVNPDRIYSSPRGRAKATAQPACELLNMQYTVEDWTTESMDYMQYPDLTDPDTIKKGWNSSFAEGVHDFEYFVTTERADALDEMMSCSDEFLERHGYKKEGLYYRAVKPNDEKIAVFCHGGFGGAWISYLLSLPPAMGWMHLALNTTSVTKFVFENRENGFTFPRCVYLGDTSHLKK